MRPALLLIALALPAFAGDELTVYELLAPASHKFAIVYVSESSTPPLAKN
jgi:hypothetical protein